MANDRSSINLLPSFFRTDKNKKFLSSTIDQFISVPALNRIEAFAGSKNTPNYKESDLYIQESNPLRQAYQLEPALVLKTLDQEIKKVFGLDDLLNQINNKGGDSSDLNRIFEPNFYSFDPKISWDKFINFREYYWLPSGPSTINISGNTKSSLIEYNITDTDDKNQFLFNGLTPSQNLILYRGTTYIFNVDSINNFYIKYSSTADTTNLYENAQNNGTSKGQIIFTVNWQTPDSLYYSNNFDQLSVGRIIIKEPSENTAINVEDEIIGKKNYTSAAGVKFINGLKIKFVGLVFPEKYRDLEFIVEGVGQSINLVQFNELDNPDFFDETINSRFDGTNFDQFPFDNFRNIPLVPEYVTINKASKDKNPWSRYNRWFHSDVIRSAAEFNNTTPIYPVEYKALRPIIEFSADMHLYNFGKTGLKNIDLIDNSVTDAFNQVEGQNGYYLDGTLLEEGYRVIFNNDKNADVRNKIYRVNFVIVGDDQIIDLVPEDDIVIDGSSVLIKLGQSNSGDTWYFKNANWIKSQQKTERNQAPLFELYDLNGMSFSERNANTNFAGNKIFGYTVGTGPKDSVLGFPLQYKNVGVEGTYLFTNYFATEEFLVVENNVPKIIPTSSTYFQIGENLVNVWTKVESYSIPIRNGVYDPPVNLTNNPLNDVISELTLTELSDHIKSMTEAHPDFNGVFPGVSNIKDLPNLSNYGSKLICNINPLSFSQLFLTDEENSAVNSIRLVGENYQQFKLNLLKFITISNQDLSPIEALDNVLLEINQNKTTAFPYFYSDMLSSGKASKEIKIIISETKTKLYRLPTEYSDSLLSNKGLLVYLNNEQLTKDFDYFVENNSIVLSKELAVRDVLEIKLFASTSGSFIPPTPTKLGLYPKYQPMFYFDDTVVGNPVKVLQGHDGSITVAFNDYRDNILLEFEKRVYNNLKTEYNPDLFDINKILPSVYRTQDYSYDQIFNPVYKDYLKWKSTYSVEAEKNLTFDINNTKTFNYSSVILNGNNLPGHWRAIFKLFFDTDRPHTHPWEMLGFSLKPVWWEDEYGSAPYTSGNLIMWNDIAQGKILHGARQGIDKNYIRSNLLTILPIDAQGKLIDIRSWGPIGQNSALDYADGNWKFGDIGPAENAWRRSSYWPFAVQIIAAILKPATYLSLMFDPSRLSKNLIGQYVFRDDNLFFNHKKSLLPYQQIADKTILTSGYSVFVVEAGQIRSSGYLDQLRSDLDNSSFNLLHKVGGFVSKDKLDVVIDSVNPTSVSPGILLPVEDYTIHFNVSNPVKIINLSGIIVQKSNDGFILRGYDRVNPYFTIKKGLHSKFDSVISVGGTSEDFVAWSVNTFYSIGKVVSYDNSFYRVNNNHNSGTSFNSANYGKLQSLPTINAITVEYPSAFEQEDTQVAYGSVFSTIQEVADIIAGYGVWLESQGFIFDELSPEISEILNWKLSIKEFIYWASQGWAANSVIALSPFANSFKYEFQDAVVDNVLDSFYEYSILRADGFGISPTEISIVREGNACIVKSKNDAEGIFFTSLRLVQKEHVLVLNNTSRFNDVIYDVETGYRQRRIKLIGFKTAEWNGDYLSPGFIYDAAKITSWLANKDYIAGDVVEYAGNYYSLDKNLAGTATFNFTQWNKLGKKPIAQLIPNFEYKINQFEDFYSLDIDNFDISQQRLAQQLTGYSPRVYLSNIFFNQLAQYKFFQGFIREKGTKNALDKLVRASVHNLQGKIDFNEEWAFRIGSFGAYSSLNEIEFPLQELKVVDNNQLIKVVDEIPSIQYDSTNYITPNDFTIKSTNLESTDIFQVSKEADNLNPFALPVAGYVRLDDVDYTVKTKEELFKFQPGKNIRVGDTIWVAFDDSGDWGAYRYARLNSAVVETFDVVAGQKLGFTTDRYHGLAVGDIIAITRFSEDLNGTYKIVEVPRLNTFVVESDKYSNLDTTQYGVLFKFLPARFNRFDDIANQPYLADFKNNKKIWIDKNDDNFWEVYEKVDNFKPYQLTYPYRIEQPGFGNKIVSKEESDLVIISAPLDTTTDEDNGGRIYVYSHVDGVIRKVGEYGVNLQSNQEFYASSVNVAQIGKSIDFDGIDQVVVAGAPFASNVKADQSVTNADTFYVSSLAANRNLLNEGMVVISTADIAKGVQHHVKLACKDLQAGMNFGHSVFISTTATDKTLLVGAPGFNNNTGAVYSFGVRYSVSFDGTLTQVTSTATVQVQLPTSNLTAGCRFGENIAGDKLGSRIAVSVPGFDNSKGAVHIYKNTGTTQVTYIKVQEIKWNDPDINGKVTDDGQFAYDLDMDDSGTWLFISAYNTFDRVLEKGKVLIYKWNGNQFVYSQILDNPSSATGMKFGQSIESDASGNILVVSALGSNYFDALTLDEAATTFDAEATKLGTLVQNSGSAYVYNRYGDKFIFADELFNSDVKENSNYGYAVSVNRNSIYVSAPTYKFREESTQRGNIHVWDTIDPSINSWNLLRSQDSIIDVSKLRQIKTIDSFDQSVLDYIDVIDPIKGKISQIADQEIRYKTLFDPAVYNTGTNQSTNIEPERSWNDEQVGELWWDLSSVKFVWYEQGSDEYRRNAWGSIFPGCSIDIYEWVKSDFPPQRWASDADTVEGLAFGISGQPKYTDNSAYCTEQIYSPVTDEFVNVYYFWVKNKVIVPNRQGRQLSAFDVALLITDPKLYGLKFIQPISKSSLALVNIKGDLINNRILLNMQLDDIDNQRNKHTEWLLLEENSSTSMPNSLLEKKMIDSLLGRDNLGNPVPDPTLSDRLKYGIEIRPRQSMFKNRIAALRNFIDFLNRICQNNLIVDYYSLQTLQSKEEIPETISSEYDIIVEDIEARDSINISILRSGKISCTIENGRIVDAIIIDPGYGYGKLNPVQFDEDNNVVTWRGPQVLIDTVATGHIETEINVNGEIVFANIVDPGEGYITVPTITVRPYTVLVKSDVQSRGLWSKYKLDDTNQWVKIQTQSYNTSLYWDYADYKSADYNEFKKISATLDMPHELYQRTFAAGDYIKINNNGKGNYLILRKTGANEIGKYNSDFDVVFSQNGTIRIKDSLWKLYDSQFGWDQISPYDNTLWDQTPDIELQKVIEAFRDDIFVGSLKVNWNNAFFACVKYALTEQKFLDWAFKTSFINVKNLAGQLIQRPVYKFQDTKWYEDYLKEIKPYHTNVRSYTLNYSVDEPSNTFTTDFDLPVVYNDVLDQYVSLDEDNPLILQYPYKGWFDNRKLFVESIAISYPGEGYVEAPLVQIIPAQGDVITREAKAEAYISAGKVYRIEVIDAGEGYLQTPNLILVGGVSEEGSTARAHVKMANGKVRSNLIGIKFDRVAKSKQIGNKDVVDIFTATGATSVFDLSWPANPDKTLIDCKVNGITIPFSSYDLEDFTKVTGGYNKQYTRLILNSVPVPDSIVRIKYRKSFDVYTAYDRIEDYFDPVPEDSPGKNPAENHAQLMTGIEYPGTEIVTSPLWTDYSWDKMPFDSVTWNKLNFGTDDLDVIIDGGTTTATSGIFASAAGINPSDIILDGDKFISPVRSHAPEELVPGEVKETVGINVFTREVSGSPMIYTQFIEAEANQETVIDLKITPPSNGSVRLTYNRKVFRGVVGDDYTIEDEAYREVYRIDYSQKKIYVRSQFVDGLISVTYMDVGGTNFISMNHSYTEGSTEAVVLGDCLFDQVQSVYVTLDGERVEPTPSTSTYYYVLSESVPGKDRRAKVTVYGLGTLGAKTVTAAFFGSKFKGFSEVYEQLIVNQPAGSRAITLVQPPGYLGPISANSIVEVNGRRIIPPNTTYYEINSVNQLVFDISKKEIYSPNSFDKTRIEVYKNGLLVIPGDYYLDDANNQIRFASGFFSIGDVLAITAFVDYDYFIRGDIIEINERIPLFLPNYIRILTFNNHDSSLIRTEVFKSSSNGLYKISRKIVNDNFIWVTVGGNTLTSGADFRLLNDGYSIQLAPTIPYSQEDDVIITSFGNTEAGRTVGYRIFKDPLNRQHFKRLSKPATTYLSQPLLLTDTEIHVNDANVLPNPDIRNNAPGIILIAGERIEYFEKNDNVLSKIKRATLGTGAKEFLDEGTWVIDQSKRQTVPFKETTVVQTISTSTSTISLNTATFTFINGVEKHDQVEIYYGGKLLEKPTASGVFRYVHDATKYYDPINLTVRSPDFTITATTASVFLSLSFVPSADIQISIVQRRSVDWYIDNKPFIATDTPQATFIRQVDAVSIDQMYYGGDPVLRFDDGTPLLSDDGNEIRGY